MGVYERGNLEKSGYQAIFKCRGKDLEIKETYILSFHESPIHFCILKRDGSVFITGGGGVGKILVVPR